MAPAVTPATTSPPTPPAPALLAPLARGCVALSQPPSTRLTRWLVDGIARALADEGYTMAGRPGPGVGLVLHPVDAGSVRPFRRRRAPVFVVAVGEVAGPVPDLLAVGYPMLVRALANLALFVTPSPAGPRAAFVTLEQGTYTVDHTGDDDTFFAAVVERLSPLAASRLVIDNDLRPDLEQSLWDGDPQTREIARAGEHLDALGLLPSPYPIEQLLSHRDLRHVKLLFGIGGLSYGNVSARCEPRRESPFGPEFWMSGSGVDKANLRRIGRDVLLVRGYDPTRDSMVLAVPPDVTPNRVSVDAIEHWAIYREHPDVGAILHVHGWIDGTPATDVNYPCGTLELAGAVADLVRRAPDPSRAVVGQRNHGLTITGHSLDEIFARVGDRIVPHVPMS